MVATNARLSKVEAAKLAEFAGLGMARTIYPVYTMFDGDTTFALSIGDARADVNTLGVAAAEAVAQAVVRAVQNAPSMGGVPGLAGETAAADRKSPAFEYLLEPLELFLVRINPG